MDNKFGVETHCVDMEHMVETEVMGFQCGFETSWCV